MGIALDIYRICRETVRAHDGGRLQSVRVAIGELAAVEPELLAFAWEAALAGEEDAGAELRIDWCPALQQCASCGEVKERAPGSWLRLCPDCGQPLQVSGGDELDVLEVTFAQEEPSSEEDPPLAAEEAR
jgi:hydrogenase nickel incorporation protein HypA/HybF